jgi:outer membrane lipoprotein-sorting protein
VPKRAYTLIFLLFILPACPSRSIQPLPVLVKPPGSLRAEATVELEKIEFKGRAVILVKSPDLVRMDLLGPFNHVVSVIVSDSEGLSYYSNGEVRRYGWDDPLLPYPLRPGELVSLLMGRPELKGYYEFSTDGEGNISKLVKLSEGAAVLKVSMDDWREVQGLKIPFAIAIEDGGERVNIRYFSVELDPVIGKDLFILPARPPRPARGLP